MIYFETTQTALRLVDDDGVEVVSTEAQGAHVREVEAKADMETARRLFRDWKRIGWHGGDEFSDRERSDARSSAGSVNRALERHTRRQI